MGQYDTPSGERFGPPPGSDRRFEPPASTPTRRLAYAGFGLVLLRIVADWYRGRAGETSLSLALLAVGLLVAELVLHQKRRKARGDTPFSRARHLTR